MVRQRKVDGATRVIPEDPAEIAVREGEHKRIQAGEDKEAEATVEEMLEVPPEYNEVPDLMMEDQDVRPATEGAAKWKMDEGSPGAEKTAERRCFLP